MQIHSKAKVDFYKTYLERYVSILCQSKYIHHIRIYDVFCGMGIYEDGGKGSPVVAYDTIKNIYETHKVTNNTEITLVVNDKSEARIARVQEYIESNKHSYCKVRPYNLEIGQLLGIIIPEINITPNDTRNLVFIDPYGYKDIKKELLLDLMENGRTEVILFLPIWEYKTRILASTSHLKLNEDILKKPHWTIEDIDERTRFLITCITRLYPYYEAKGEIVTKIPVVIDCQEGCATGTFYPDNGSIEVLESSVLNTAFSTPEKYPWVEDQRQELMDDGVIAYNDKQQLVFTQNYTFYAQMKGATALSSVASIILHGNRNGWEYWLTEDGKQLGQVEGLKKGKE